MRIIKEKTGGIDCEDGEIMKRDISNLKKELFLKNRDPPTAMGDPETGNLLTSLEKIEYAAVKTEK